MVASVMARYVGVRAERRKGINADQEQIRGSELAAYVPQPNSLLRVASLFRPMRD